MKKLLIAGCGLMASFAASAIPVTPSTVISFSTPGPDTYADGTTVKDGECYALVWSKDGVFEGINAKGEPVDANDKVLLVMPIAKDGKCPPVLFTIGNDVVTDGMFDVMLLDTRTFNGEGAASVAGVDAEGKLTIVNQAVKVGATVKNSAESVASTGGEKADLAAGAAAPVPEGAVQPKISNITFRGDTVILEVQDTVGYLNYAVQGGETPAADGAVGEAKTGNGTIYLVAPKTGNAGFFKVIRK